MDISDLLAPETMDFMSMLKDMAIDDEAASVHNDELLKVQINMTLICPIPLQNEEKSNEAAEHFIQEGDEYMSRCMHQEAVYAYTNGLRLAIPNSETAATCYYSRATALQRMKAYEEFALDVERALQLPLSDEKNKRILQMQNRLSELRSAQRRKQKRNGQKEEINKDVEISYGENPEVPGATNAIKLAYNTRYGRYFVATKPITAGDVLLVQEPYLLFVFKQKELCFCHHCLKPTMALIPCDSCTSILFCSPECRSKAYDKYHRIECKLSGCNADIMLHLRLFLIATDQGATLGELINYMKEQNKEADPRRAGFTNNQFNGKTAQALLSLTAHDDKGLFFGFITTSSIITVLLKKHTNILDEHDIYDVGKLVLRLICIFNRNVVMIRDKSFEDISAQALYPVFNLLNHSCVTNTIWYTSKSNHRVLLACRDIKPGEQIFNNYLGQSILCMNAKKRRELLSRGKYFICNCEACSNNYDFKRELRRLKVPVRLQRQLRKNPFDTDSIWQVLKCMYHEIKLPCADVELMKFILMEAYMNKQHPAAFEVYRSLGVL